MEIMKNPLKHYGLLNKYIIIIFVLFLILTSLFTSPTCRVIFTLSEILGIFFSLGDLKDRLQKPEISPKKEKFSGEAEIAKFLSDFICQSTSATIVTNRASWFNATLVEKIQNKNHLKITIYLHEKPTARFTARLNKCKVDYKIIKHRPTARFTLLNPSKLQSAKLAIARGTNDEHTVTTFDSSSGPEIIALANDIIKGYENKDAK